MLTKKEKDQLHSVLSEEKDRLVKNAKDSLRSSMEHERSVGRDSIDESMEEEIFSTELRLRDREKYMLNKIDEAFERLENGTIDLCEECGDKILFKRLLARPTTTLCIDCKEELEKSEQMNSYIVKTPSNSQGTSESGDDEY